MKKDLSSLRSQLRDTHQKLQSLLDAFLGREPLLKGSLYNLRRKCGKPTCRCAHGEPHASTVLSYRGQGRPQNISPPPEKVAKLRKLTDDYRRFRQARTQLVRLQRQLVELVDLIEAARTQLGEVEFRPVSKSRSRR
jgi:hypothetical protein